MNAYTVRTLLRRQFTALRYSWSLWTLIIVALFFAVLSPVTARYMPEMLQAMVGTEDIPIDLSAIPDPTSIDSWTQWASNLSQIVVMIIAIIGGAVISSDVSKGTIVAILARPVRRSAVWLTGFVAASTTILCVLMAATAAEIGGTFLLFSDVTEPWRPIVATALYLVFAFSLIAITMAASSAGANALGATATGIGYYGTVSIASLWPAARPWSPAGLLSAVAELSSGSTVETPDLVGSIASTVILTALAIAVGLYAFNRREL
ncbi:MULTISPECIES: ABC transporter permease [unclassified Corynebacterium]|uniref:ABC transporter permease n=1 Tax=unclassified Corynebacterium TaxID=2624378 RepID=UPI00309B4887